jgi:hypothetical protein
MGSQRFSLTYFGNGRVQFPVAESRTALTEELITSGDTYGPATVRHGRRRWQLRRYR